MKAQERLLSLTSSKMLCRCVCEREKHARKHPRKAHLPGTRSRFKTVWGWQTEQDPKCDLHKPGKTLAMLTKSNCLFISCFLPVSTYKIWSLHPHFIARMETCFIILKILIPDYCDLLLSGCIEWTQHCCLSVHSDYGCCRTKKHSQFM